MSNPKPLKLVHQLLESHDYSAILTRLISQAQQIQSALRANASVAQRESACRIALGPIVAELFQPQHNRDWGCVLLRAVRSKWKGLSQPVRALCEEGNQLGLPASVRLRAMTIDLTHSNQLNADDIELRLAKLLDGYRTLWNTPVWSDDPPTIATSLQPAAWKVLEQLDRQLAKVLKKIVKASPQGWQDPAAVFLADSLVESLGGHVAPDPAAGKHCGQTWVLIAIDERWKRSTQPTGLVLYLQVERLPHGCGAFYPHPDYAAHLQIDKTFQQSLRNAWQVVLVDLSPVADARQFDYRWQVVVVDDSHEVQQPRPFEVTPADDVIWHRLRHLLCFAPLSGRSGEIAIAAALKSVVEQIPLDRSRAATGHFDGEFPRGPHPGLHSVLSVLLKDIGLVEANEVLERSTRLGRIEELVLPTGQPSALPLMRPPVFVGDFHDAWQKLSEHSLFTQRYHAAALASTNKWFHDHCFGDEKHYIRNDLVRRTNGKSVALSSAQADRLVMGQFAEAFELRPTDRRPRLVKVVADSGIGKTSFLVHCQHQITRLGDDRVAIRIDRLVDLLATPGRAGFLEAAVTHVVDLMAPGVAQTEKLRQEVRTWLDRKAEHGEVVWLLDALDQMSESNYRGRVLRSFPEAFPLCPMILTLRPDADQAHAAGLRDWVTLDLQPFDEDAAKQYLGEYADLFFERLPIQDSEGQDDRDGHVLTMPLLLHLLKELVIKRGIAPRATAVGLPEFRNRYTIYRAVMSRRGGLLEKGFQTFKERDPDWQVHFGELDDAIDLLQRLASQQLRLHHFDTAVPHALFVKLKRWLRQEYSESMLPAIKQLNLLTGLPTFDEAASGGMKWRHRSFLEYLGGCRLAELFANPKMRPRVVAALLDIHSVLDESHNFRAELLNDDKTCRHLPRDWQWTLRFALAHAQHLHEGAADRSHRDGHNVLACQLIRFGNPWVVYDAIDRDGLQFDANVDQVCRWLVHRDRTIRNYRGAWKISGGPPTVDALVPAWVALSTKPWLRSVTSGDAGMKNCLDELPSRATRDTAFLHPLLELLDATITEAKTNAKFAPEAEACQTALSTYLNERTFLRTAVLAEFEGRFIPIPAGTFDPAQFHNKTELAAAGVTSTVTIAAGLEFAEFPVTNEEIETWCPTQRRWRELHSHADDQPAVWVSWFMGTEFARWLTGNRQDGTYALPTEWEWEYACRAGNQEQQDYWWGQKMRDDFFCTSETGSRGRTQSWRNSVNAHLIADVVHPSLIWAQQTGLSASYGLLDLHGNVWEWCDSRYISVIAGRVVRGGSWNDNADYARSAYRRAYDPDDRDDNIGLRLVWRVGVSPSESSTS